MEIIFFLEILLEDFKEDVSVFVTITQMKPERCKKAEKEQEPYKILQHNSFSIPLLSSANRDFSLLGQPE